MMRGIHGIANLRPRRPRYVPGEVLILGLEADVQQLLQRAPAAGTRLDLLDRLALPASRSFRRRPPVSGDPWAGVPPAPGTASVDVVRLRLPALAAGEGSERSPVLGPAATGALEEAADGLRALAADAGLAVHVEPHCIVGDPLEWETDTLARRVMHVGEDPAGGERLFLSQPAFRMIGLTDETGRRLLPPEEDGAQVMVAVLDTAPARRVSPTPFPPAWLTIHPGAPTPGLVTPSWTEFRDLSDHGLICASLVHAVAPAAEIHLYRVLNDAGEGDLFGLLRAVADFATRSRGRFAVMNLSLGSTCPASGTDGVLAQALMAFAEQGGVTCAAAGNTAAVAAKASAIPAAQPPASLPYTIAVAAATRAGQRASYSHRGDIAAPGGEALGVPGPGDTDDLIGMAASHPEAAFSGYVAMDAGTSFSTPLVAGASALMLQAISHWPAGVTLERGIDRVVLDLLARSATPPPDGLPNGDPLATDGLGAGILHLGQALELSKVYR
ncbi:S8/S53 family peptidase [Limnochorda pilosa]|uniref:Peptidase S8/S53 domain-containing protein n=1 Tax=Limnochorda pilosa TaxID=1555112 RepID=A0A0K2SJM7_LIMPI|nr:S8/S53 family peptidase [Limnochorda pilosa]BAS27316.1 hypothetical protein LIP_1467 [Limnochorda pilosa]